MFHFRENHTNIISDVISEKVSCLLSLVPWEKVGVVIWLSILAQEQTLRSCSIIIALYASERYGRIFLPVNFTFFCISIQLFNKFNDLALIEGE